MANYIDNTSLSQILTYLKKYIDDIANTKQNNLNRTIWGASDTGGDISGNMFVGDNTKVNNYLEYANGAINLQGNIFITGGNAATTDYVTTAVNESSGLNKWILSKYVDSSLPYGADVSLEDLSKLTPVSIIEDTDPGTSTFNQMQGFSFNTDNYVGKATTYIYFSADTDISHNLYSDDAGRVYINGSLIGKLESCVITPFTLPFKKGWNRVDLIWSERSGVDVFSLLGLILSTYANVIKMTAYPKGELESLISKTYTDSSISNAITTAASDAASKYLPLNGKQQNKRTVS
jgi:hypothetical protein